MGNWDNKDEMRAKAIEHRDKMEIMYSKQIVDEVKYTRLFEQKDIEVYN